MIQYIVQPGDSLYTIGIRFKTSVSALMQANHISDPNMIYPGQVLKIPLPFRRRTVPAAFRISGRAAAGPLYCCCKASWHGWVFIRVSWTASLIPPPKEASGNFRSAAACGLQAMRTYIPGGICWMMPEARRRRLPTMQICFCPVCF